MSLRRPVGLLATLLVCVLGLLQLPGAGIAAPAVAPAVHASISRSLDATHVDTDFERGPPTAPAQQINYAADSRWSCGASVRPGQAATPT